MSHTRDPIFYSNTFLAAKGINEPPLGIILRKLKSPLTILNFHDLSGSEAALNTLEHPRTISDLLERGKNTGKVGAPETAGKTTKPRHRAVIRKKVFSRKTRF